MRFDSIQSRLVIVALFFIVAASLTMALIAIGLTTDYLGEKTKEHFGVLAKYMARNAELGVILKDRRMLERFVKNMLEQRNIIHVTILSSSGKTLVSLGKEIEEKATARVEAPVVIALLGKEDMMLDRSTDYKEVGKVILVYSLAGLHQLKKAMARRFLLISVGLSMIPVFLYWFFARFLVAPLNDLLEISKEVSKGNMDVRAKGGRLLETRTLAATFNDMLASLKRRQMELEQAHKKMARQHALAEVGKFSMMVAHEVKNPLSIIKGSMDILKKKDICEDTRNTLWIYIEDEVVRINRLMEDFLLFARPKKPQFGTVEINKALRELLQKVTVMKDNGGPEIRSDIETKECVVSCDRHLMDRAILNILRNALDICGPEDRIDVISCSDNETWVFTVKDTGTGIPPDELGRIFEPFFTSRAKGTGLGLAMTKDIVKAHGGEISVRNRDTGGACFEIRLKREVKKDEKKMNIERIKR